jgi:hypothetical protein
MKKQNQISGFVKVFRSFTEWEWYDQSETVHLFLHLLLKANHKPNKWRGYQIDRGQLITSIDHLSKQLGLSVQTVRTVLKRLELTGEITRQSTNRNTMITICNYDDYQSNSDDANKPDNNPDDIDLTNDQQTPNNQVTTNKNDKNFKNEKEYYLFIEKNISLILKNSEYISTVCMSNQIKKVEIEKMLRKFCEKFYPIDHAYDEINQDKIQDHFKNYLNKITRNKKSNYKKGSGSGSNYDLPDNR